jgi:signal transduction histidine kinase
VSNRRPSLRGHLVVSHLLVVVAVVVALAGSVRLLVPRLFEDRVGDGPGGSGQGPPAQAGQLREAVVSSLNRALVVGAVVGLALGLLLALLLARRLVRPLQEVQTTTRALAGGDLGRRVAPPRVSELAEVAADVNVLAEHLERTEERRRQLVAELAHELRTPITTVQGFVEGFQDGVIEPTPESFAELADEVRRLERLTADLGLLSRLDEGQVALELQAVDLGAVARQVVLRLRPQSEASGLAVDLAGSDGVQVRADADRLRQVLSNLVGNAVRYTGAGGTIRVEWGADARWGWCSVSDTGPGLRADELETVFDRFTRGSAGAGIPGSGVGLTIARSLARAQGGDVVVVSDGPGCGATFTLPAAQPAGRRV